jgi:hypothetical protein
VGRGLPAGGPLGRAERTAVGRAALRGALEAHGLLTISPPGGDTGRGPG